MLKIPAQINLPTFLLGLQLLRSRISAQNGGKNIRNGVYVTVFSYYCLSWELAWTIVR